MIPSETWRHACVRSAALAAILLLTLSSCRLLPSGMLEPAVVATPQPTPLASPIAATKTMCEAAADLRVDIDFLRSLDIREDGLVSFLVGVDAALGETRLLVDLVAEEYRPLVVDLAFALQSLRMTIDGLGEESTVGAGIASIGTALTEIGETLDTLTLRIREPCEEADP